MVKVFKIDILMPTKSQYEVLHHFARKLNEAFARQGAECRLLAGDERLYASLRSPPDFTIGFNGAIKMEDDSLFCDHIKVPHVSCLVDPPFRFLEITKSPYVMIACDDKEGCTLLKGRDFKRTVFMPHAVERELSPDTSQERLYDIAFLGTCIDAEARRKLWKKHFPVQVCRYMEEAAQVGLDESPISFMSVLLKYLDPAKYQRVFEEVEVYIKGVDRLRLLEAFPGRTIHIFGSELDEWKKVLKTHENIVVHGPVSYEQAIEVMQKTKVLLNSSIKNKLGAHERVFTGAACGAVVVTNDNGWVREHFQDGKEMLFYNCKTLKDLDEGVKILLNNEEERTAVAKAGRLRVMQGHTWDHRVERLLEEIRPMLKIVA